MSRPLWTEPLEVRLWGRVEEVGDCWLWRGATSRGYGRVRYEGQQVPVHRLAYRLVVGVIPDGMHIDHLCRNPTCINPAHLEPVTIGENIRRGAGVALRKMCSNGLHPWTPENIKVIGRNRRKCLPCRQAKQKRTHARRREEFNARNRAYYWAKKAEAEQSGRLLAAPGEAVEGV